MTNRQEFEWPSKILNLSTLVDLQNNSIINYILCPVNFSSSAIFNGLLMSESDAGKPVRHKGRVTYGLHFFYISISYIFYIILRVSISNNCASENQFVLIVLLWWWRPFRCALLHHCIYTVITCKLHLNPPCSGLGKFGLRSKVKGWKLSDFIPFPVSSSCLQEPRSCIEHPSSSVFSQSPFYSWFFYIFST